MQFQTALITGAASGIGRQLALALARENVVVAGLDLQTAGLESLAREIPSRFVGRTADVTRPEELREAVQEVEAKIGPLDLMIASAGIGRETSGLNLRPEDMNAVLNVNLLGVCNTIAAVLPSMIERKKGHLAALSSLASYMGLPRMLGYCASKAGVNAIMEGLRIELAPWGISTTTVCPGWIRTPMTEQIGGTLPRLMEPEDAARRILAAIQARRRFVAFPAGMVWQMRFLKMLPSWVREPLLRKMLQRLRPREEKPAHVE